MRQGKVDTGEDLETLLRVNPLSPEVSFTVNADYASEAGLRKIKAQVEKMGLGGSGGRTRCGDGRYDEHQHRKGCIRKRRNRTGAARHLVRVDKTTRSTLTIYSRRFTINTMQLVGATTRFIRRPIVGNNPTFRRVGRSYRVGESWPRPCWAHRGWATLDISARSSRWWQFRGKVAAALVIAGALRVFGGGHSGHQQISPKGLRRTFPNNGKRPDTMASPVPDPNGAEHKKYTQCQQQRPTLAAR